MKKLIVSGKPYPITFVVVFTIILTASTQSCSVIDRIRRSQPNDSEVECKLELIRSSEDGTHFVLAESAEKFVAWGFNYDHDGSGRLIEEYWHEDWSIVEEDFKEMKELGANVVRIHLQIGRFMTAPEEPNKSALKQLARLLMLAEETGLYLDITGLGCYHKKDVPEWYEAMGETARWKVQARFWEEVSKTCTESPAVFCYDLMNEPIIPNESDNETEWAIAGPGGKQFVQRITLRPEGRDRVYIAKCWVDTLVAAIRKYDDRHMITVGVIPWAYIFPNTPPLFYSNEVGENLDFVSVHFYPRKDEIDNTLTALEVYDVGKPLVVEEMAPLRCNIDEIDSFIDGSRDFADGYITFYWGKTIDEYTREGADLSSIFMKSWLEYFRMKASEIFEVNAGIQD